MAKKSAKKSAKKVTPTADKKAMPKVVSAKAWDAARKSFLKKEKAATRARDKLAAQRRRLPMYKIEKDYAFDGPEGKARLIDLFDGRRQLVLYHFMFAPDVDGWPDAGCPGCSFMLDQFGNSAHLNARDTSLVIVSKAPLENIERYRQRMGWQFPWYSSADTDFNEDFGRTQPKGEIFGLSVFLRDGDDVYRTYFIESRGVEMFGSPWSFLDLTAYGRQETWEDSPKGWPQTKPYIWWRRHDDYGKG